MSVPPPDEKTPQRPENQGETPTSPDAAPAEPQVPAPQSEAPEAPTPVPAPAPAPEVLAAPAPAPNGQEPVQPEPAPLPASPAVAPTQAQACAPTVAPASAPGVAADILAGFKMVLHIAGLVVRSRIPEAFDLMTTVKLARWTTLATVPIASGLMTAIGKWQAVNAFDSLVRAAMPLGARYSSDFGFGDALGAFVGGTVVVALFMVIVVGVLRLCFAVRHVPVEMTRLTSVYAASLAPLAIVLPPAFILALIPINGMRMLMIFLILFMGGFTALLSFLLSYIGIARIGRFSQSVAVPYVGFMMLGTTVYSFIISMLNMP